MSGPRTICRRAVPLASKTRRSRMRSARSSAASATCRLKFASMRRVVSTPTTTAKPHRITSVSSAEPPAIRQRSGRRLYAEDVARAADRMKDARLATGLQLPAEVRHEHLDRVRDGERVIAPDLVEQLLPRDHEALVAHEVLQQLEFALRELELAVAAADLVRIGVEDEVADAQRRHPARRAPPQEGAQPREQLLAGGRPYQGVVGAHVEGPHPRLHPGARGGDGG